MPGDALMELMEQFAHQPIDLTALLRLRQLGGDGFLKEMIDLFLEFVPQRIDLALAGERVGDFSAVAHAGHSLKSSAGNLGVTSIQTLAVDIEQKANENNRDAVRGLLCDLEIAFAEAKTCLQAVKRAL